MQWKKVCNETLLLDVPIHVPIQIIPFETREPVMRKFIVSPTFSCLPPLLASLSFLLASAGGVPGFAQTMPVPDDSKFVLNLDLQALQSSKIGGRLLSAMQESFEEEIQKSTKKFKAKGLKKLSERNQLEKLEGKDLSLEKMTEILGMNPLTEIQSLTITAGDFEHPEKSMLAQLKLRKNPGNIEGLLVSLPGYESTEIGGLTIHSAKPDDDNQLYGCLKQGKDGNYTFTISPDREKLMAVVQDMARSTPLMQTNLDDDRKTFLSLQVTDLSGIDLGEGPQSNVAKMLQGMNVSISEDSENLELRSTLLAATQKKAQQLRQAIQGVVAMLELAASMDESDEVQQILDQVRKLSVVQDDTKVRVKWSVPAAQVIEILESELNDRR
jgi:hypothetical protein